MEATLNYHPNHKTVDAMLDELLNDADRMKLSGFDIEAEYARWVTRNFYVRSYYERGMYLYTTSDWYPTVPDNYIKAFLDFNRESNLELARIHLGGFDDFSMSKDIVGFDKAIEEWNTMCMVPDITLEWCRANDFYFSN